MSLETGLTVDKQPAAPGSVLGTHHHNETFRSLIASSSSSATTSTSSIITSASTEAYNYEHDNEHVHIINNGNSDDNNNNNNNNNNDNDEHFELSSRYFMPTDERPPLDTTDVWDDVWDERLKQLDEIEADRNRLTESLQNAQQRACHAYNTQLHQTHYALEQSKAHNARLILENAQLNSIVSFFNL